MQDAKARRFDAIVVEAQDRLWRDQAEMHAALRRLRFWGVRVFTVETGSDLTDRAGSIVAAVMGWRDETYLDSLREKTHRGLLGQIARGMSPGGRPYGYRSEPIYDQAHQDTYGRPAIIGYRRVICPEEAAVVRRVFEMYATGCSTKAVAHRLNEEHVPPPRWRNGVPMRGWTPSTIHGSPKKANGILHNPLYIGRVVWNRSQKLRDPDTGRRITRRRPEGEWVWTDAADLRIIPDDLWHKVQARVQARYQQQHWAGDGRTRDPRGGHRRHLFSGLLVCGVCGSAYTIYRANYYGCASATHRGTAICANGRLARKDVLEERLLRAIEQRVFSPEAVAYLTRQVNAALEQQARQQPASDAQRQRVEADLAKARTELNNISAAIRKGIITPTTRAMLEGAEANVARLEASLADPPGVPTKTAAVVPP